MNGLKVYINPDNTRTPRGQGVFYSRRENGPYYRWRYEEGLGQWLFSRAHPSELMPKSLCPANWRDVPTALRARLDEHYLE
ncbi:MAG TPA: hypothetical protein VGC91_00035 [Pyrinomonadaceae bacterium]|jgi:hypothetical protein